MKIIKYDRQNEALYIRYNTIAVWRYLPVSIKDYNLIITSSSPEKTLRKTLKKLHIVGVNKEVK
jgi:Na+/H+-dicarboxylate symporter